MKQIILGSQSPRRKELLQLAGIPCSVIAADIDESIPASLAPQEAPVYLAGKKAEAILQLVSGTPQADGIIITSDTIVVCDDTILGKPRDAAHARSMLLSLSGKTHEVITGVGIRQSASHFSHTSVVRVTFKPLTGPEIDYYIQHYRPYDKAGSYAIQEWIGAIGITAIEGDYYSVMGLPVQWVYSILKEKFNFTLS